MTIEYLRTLKKKRLLLDVSLWSGDLLNLDDGQSYGSP